MRIEYVAYIHKHKGGTFGVSFPKFPECHSTGGTPRRAIENGQAALRKHINACLEKDADLPNPCRDELNVGDAFGMVFVPIDLPTPARQMTHRHRSKSLS